jgi:hypothetical protein
MNKNLIERDIFHFSFRIFARREIPRGGLHRMKWLVREQVKSVGQIANLPSAI